MRQSRQIHAGHGASRKSRLRLRDQQQGIESGDEPVNFRDGRFCVRKTSSFGKDAQHAFQAVAQAIERRPQIVRHRIGHLAHPLHQPLDTVEHLVHVVGQRVELISCWRDRQPAGQVARHNFARAAVDSIQPRDKVPTHRGPADQAKGERENHAPGQGGRE